MNEIDAIIVSVFEINEASLKDEFTMKDIPTWDSLRHMELIAAVESKFNFELSFEEISEMTSIGNIRKIISKKTS